MGFRVSDVDTAINSKPQVPKYHETETSLSFPASLSVQVQTLRTGPKKFCDGPLKALKCVRVSDS